MATERDVAASYRAAMRDEIDDLAAQITLGTAATFDEYQALCGQLAGLNKALNLFEECMQFDGDEGESSEEDDTPDRAAACYRH